MTNKKLFIDGFLDAGAMAVYTAGVAGLMFYGGNIFGSAGMLGPLGILLLFVLSALVTSLLILGRPAYLYLNNAKKDGIKLLIFTVWWLFIFTLFVFFIPLSRGLK
ncbi:MAG: hypothetical protein Q8N98_05510 [bacterium]|nr:hypothetical protein [bacterium]